MTCQADSAEAQAALDFLKRLVASRSPNPPGDERVVAQIICEEAARLGLPEPQHYARSAHRPNLIFTIGSGTPSLMLAAHMDTVPPGNLAAWSSDPYVLTRQGDRLVGLGSADMKAAIAAMLFAAARVHQCPEHQGTLTLVFSADEEAGSAEGMEWLLKQGLLNADGAAMTEPAGIGTRSWQRLFVAQRGHCVCWLVAHGKPGHSGDHVPRKERASYAFAKALDALVESDPFADWAHPVDGTKPTLNVATMVQGGMVPFAHPPILKACIEVRVIEGMTEQLVLDRLGHVVSTCGLGARVTIEPADAPLNWISPGTEAKDLRLLEAAKTAWRGAVGSEPILGVMTGGTDATNTNAAGIPTLPAFGPGSLGVAQQPNESLPAEDLSIAINLFEIFILQYYSLSKISAS